MKEMKIRIESPEHSEKVQKALFEMGYSWWTTQSGPQYTDKAYLYANEDCHICYSNSNEYFEDHCFQEYVLFGCNLVKTSEIAAVAEQKPPLGLRPRSVVDDERIREVVDAIHRYVHAGKVVPTEWIEELSDLNFTRNVK